MRKAVLALTTMLFVIGTIGTNIGPALIDEHPRLILMLSARNRNLFGAVPYIDLMSYLLIGFTRVLIAGVALFWLVAGSELKPSAGSKEMLAKCRLSTGGPNVPSIKQAR